MFSGSFEWGILPCQPIERSYDDSEILDPDAVIHANTYENSHLNDILI